MPRLIASLVSIALCATPAICVGETVAVAVASNFVNTTTEIVASFAKATGNRVQLSSGSTGTLYAQIVHGAPFDVLLAADRVRPAKLADTGNAVPGSRFSYALGQLVLWSRDPRLQDRDCHEALENLGKSDVRHLAIANPDNAPYGRAARETLVALGLWNSLQSELVVGENIAQTLQFVASGAASLGFVAGSQLLGPRLPATSCEWSVPESLHELIEQQAVLLKHGADNAAARAFLDFLRSDAGRTIIAAHGYGLPAVAVTR